MKISIIIPAYNVSKYIKRCILSLLNQTYKNIEIIVVNDGSTDNTLDIVKNFNVKIFDQKNSGGASSPRNTGIKNSTGDYITFVDGDDYVDKNYIEDIVKIIKKNSYDIIETPLLFEANLKNKSLLYTEYKLERKESHNFSNEYFNNELRYVIGVFYKREVIEDIYFDENVRCYEDNMFNLKVKLKSKSYLLYPKCYYHYVQNYNSLSKSVSLKHLDYIIVMNKLNNLYKNTNLTNYIENIYKNNVLAIILFKLPYLSNKYKHRKKLMNEFKKNAPNYYKKHKLLMLIFNGYILISIWFLIASFVNMNKLAIRIQSRNKYKKTTI